MASNDSPLSRRGFLKGLGALAGAAGAAAAAGCAAPQAGPATAPLPIDPLPVGDKYPAVPATPAAPPPVGQLRVFSALEARTVEALTARIMPGDADDPGAREAGVVSYIDSMLARQEGFVSPTYREPPFAEVYQSAVPPASTGYDVIWVPADQIERYGYQSTQTPREIYRIGVAAVNRHARQAFGADFPDLPEEDQDTIVGQLVDDAVPGFDELSAKAFFLTLRRHTAEGMFADPVYGGNRNLAGWRLVDFPGAQRAYTPLDLAREGHNYRPQSIQDLAPFHPGRLDHPNVILPVSGSELEHQHDPPRR